MSNGPEKHLGFAVMHNHLAVDLAMTVYSKVGESDFFELLITLEFKAF